MAESKWQSQYGRIEDGCHHPVNQIELVWVKVRVLKSVFEWIWEKITRWLNPRWQCLNPRWQNSRWLPSSSWLNDFESDWIQFESEFCAKWMRIWRWQPSELVWVRVRVEGECVWVNLREDNIQVDLEFESEFGQSVGWIQDESEFKMAAKSCWVNPMSEQIELAIIESEFFFCAKKKLNPRCRIQDGSNWWWAIIEVAIKMEFSLSQNEWLWVSAFWVRVLWQHGLNLMAEFRHCHHC